MPNHLSVERLLDNKRKTPAPVIPIASIKSPAEKKRTAISQEVVNKELPRFYTEPIFKAKKHDFF